MARTPRFPLMIPPEQKKNWEEEAEKRHLDLAAFIRQMVEKGLLADKKERNE